MANESDIVSGLMKTLNLATGLRATDFIPESISPPATFVKVNRITPATLGGDGFDYEVDLVVLVTRSRAGQEQLKAYRSKTGPQSVWAALAANKGIGLTDGTEAIIQDYRDLGIEEIAAYGYMGGAFETVVTT